MNDSRRYQRYTVNHNVNTEFEVKLAGELVQLVNFSVGDLYVLSKMPFSLGPINISVEFKNGGKIDLPGKVIRATKEGDTWGIGIDLSSSHGRHSIHKV